MQTDTTRLIEATSAWYCLRAKPKHEHIAAAHVSALSNDVATFCPRVKVKRPRAGNVVWVTEAMFPGYLFAQFDFPKFHRLVRYAHGVNDIVRFGLRYATVPDRAMADLYSRMEGGEVMEVRDPMAPGCPVDIVAGAFHGLQGTVLQVLPARQRVKILLDFLGRQMVAELDSTAALPTSEGAN